jgi:hypothetical protein
MGLILNHKGNLQVVSHGQIDYQSDNSKVLFAWRPVTVINNGSQTRIWLKRYKALYYNEQNVMNVAI